ncbi:hypothetical protein QTO34_006343 [Cnephaeus nilssonii]|uniref:Uncharacterized protein n=1 Tax=Cnephaeus nilssonii TaxID=3371016 RepID=A0AA40HKB8_CNENI|nr:hypothetical protein QTO34_006343 [Eptesicus nilssonii]
MALNHVSLCTGDPGNAVAHRAPLNGHSPLASALAKVSGDSALLARPKVTHRGPPPPQKTQLGFRTRALGDWQRLEPTLLSEGKGPEWAVPRPQARFSLYLIPMELHLLQSSRCGML